MVLTKRFSIAVLFLSVVGIAVFSCKDMGSVAAKPALTATTFSVSLSPGGQATVTITGGTPPYTVSQQPDPALASATLTNNANRSASLLIQAVSANVSGTTTMRVKDSDSHGANDSPLHEENEIEISIRVSATSVSFSTQVQPIFTVRCVNAGCHPGGGAPFPLASGVSRGNLVGVDMVNSACGGKRVLAGDANASGLIKKLEGNCGDRMPLGGSALPSAEITLIRDWISQGAQNN